MPSGQMVLPLAATLHIAPSITTEAGEGTEEQEPTAAEDMLRAAE